MSIQRKCFYLAPFILIVQFIIINFLLLHFSETSLGSIGSLSSRSGYEAEINGLPRKPYTFFELQLCGMGTYGFNCTKDTTCNSCLDVDDGSDWVRKHDIAKLQKFADQFTKNSTIIGEIKDFIFKRYSKEKPIVLMIASTFYSTEYTVFIQNMACIMETFGVGSQLLILGLTKDDYRELAHTRLKDHVMPVFWPESLKSYWSLSPQVYNDMDRVLFSLRWHIVSLLVQWEFSVLMQDADMLWLSNPISLIQNIVENEKSDLVMQFAQRRDLYGPACAGFVYINGQSVRKDLVKLFFQSMQNVMPYMRTFVRSDDQGLINTMLKNQYFRELSFRTIPKRFISNLITVNGRDVGIHDSTIVAHAISGSGIDHKKRRMKDSNLWRYDEAKKVCMTMSKHDILKKIQLQLSK